MIISKSDSEVDVYVNNGSNFTLDEVITVTFSLINLVLSGNGKLLFIDGNTGLFVYERVGLGTFTQIEQVSNNSAHLDIKTSEDGSHLASLPSVSLLKIYQRINGVYSFVQDIPGSAYVKLAISPDS